MLLVNSGLGGCERRTPLAAPQTGNNLLVHPIIMLDTEQMFDYIML